MALADPAASAESLRPACQEVLCLGEQQERLVNALLTLATSQSGLRHQESFDLAAVASQVMASLQPDADRRGVRVAASLGQAIVTGDPALAESVVANLVDNAVRHNVPGGHVHITTGTYRGRPWFSAPTAVPASRRVRSAVCLSRSSNSTASGPVTTGATG